MMSLGERRTRRFEEMRKWKKNQNIIIIIIIIIINAIMHHAYHIIQYHTVLYHCVRIILQYYHTLCFDLSGGHTVPPYCTVLP